jgi:hypothetical protein
MARVETGHEGLPQVWHRAHALVLKSTEGRQDSHRGRRTDDDFARFLDDAMGSASEVEDPLLLARDLGFLGTDAHDHLHAHTTEVKRMLPSPWSIAP